MRLMHRPIREATPPNHLGVHVRCARTRARPTACAGPLSRPAGRPGVGADAAALRDGGAPGRGHEHAKPRGDEEWARFCPSSGACGAVARGETPSHRRRRAAALPEAAGGKRRAAASAALAAQEAPAKGKGRRSG